MSLLAVRIGVAVLALLALIALRGKRWAYLAFVVLGLLSFPAQNHFQVHAPTCRLVIPTMNVVVLSLQNYLALALFAGFCWMSWVQFRWSRPRVVWAVLATVLAGALLEVAEGMTGRGLCRVQDLVPAAAGALGAALLLAFWSRLRRKPGYVRIVKPGQPAAPRQPAPPPRPVVPPPPPPSSFPAPPPDFSPTPGPLDEDVPADFSPTPGGALDERVTAARPELVRRLRAIQDRFVTMLRRFWTAIRGRRRAVAIGAVVLLVLVGTAAVVVFLLPAPPPAVVEQPKAEPAPPPRPLQSEAEGYYEPSYNFSVAGRRFTRVTLRPEPFVTFARTGTRQEAGCAEARIGRDAVFLRCELERVGMVTIDGRFTSRFVTNRLDAPVLNALITVTSMRGEVLYRARDAFRWHAPD